MLPVIVGRALGLSIHGFSTQADNAIPEVLRTTLQDLPGARSVASHIVQIAHGRVVLTNVIPPGNVQIFRKCDVKTDRDSREDAR